MKQNPGNTVYFYQGNKVVTVKQGTQSRTILRTPDMPLAEQHSGEVKSTGLLATDENDSVLHVQNERDQESHSFSAYGHNPSLPSTLTSCGFNGEHIEPLPASYLLGNGYRSYNPVLMRFLSPDSLSPFDKGGINAYGYCLGDPVNNIDPSGHNPLSFIFRSVRSLGKGALNRLKLRTPSKASNVQGMAYPNSRESVQNSASEPNVLEDPIYQDMKRQFDERNRDIDLSTLRYHEMRIENSHYEIDKPYKPDSFVFQELEAAKVARERILDKLDLPYDFHTYNTHAREANYLLNGSPRSSMNSIRSSR